MAAVCEIAFLVFLGVLMMQYTGLATDPRESLTMSRRVFLSYPCDFAEHETVGAVCKFLEQARCIIAIPPAFGRTYYEAMEAPIEQCDVFIAVLDPIADGSSQLMGHLWYAAGLQRMRWHPRPRIFGLWLEPQNKVEVNCLAGLPVEPLDSRRLSLLLEDLPPREFGKSPENR